MSRLWCHRATTHPFICSCLGERKETRLVGGGGALLVQADEENKQVQIWFLVEVERASRRVCHQTHLPSSRFSLHPLRRRVHPSIHQREGLFTFPPLSLFSSQMGGAVHHHSWGTQIFMQPPLRRHQPVVTKSPNPPLHLAAELD